jgi:predicted metal-dependent HD superfamily phosphohydrolase
MREALKARVADALVAVGCDCEVDALAEALIDAWAEPHRRYHDLAHLEDCLMLAEALAALAERPHELAVAIAFHDAVYDVRALDNEARSAAWAGRALREHGAPDDVASRVEALVLSTREHAAEAGDAALLSDIDLSVLGADEEGYARFERGVAEEFAWVDPEQYRVARRRVLERFAARERIFQTKEMRERFEDRARENLLRAIAELGAG